MEEFFKEIKEKLDKNDEVKIDILTEGLKLNIFNFKTREIVKKTSFSINQINSLISLCSRSSDEKLLALCSLLYTEKKEFEAASRFAFAAYEKTNSEECSLLYLNAVFDQVSEFLEKSEYEKATLLIENTHQQFREKEPFITNHLYLLTKLIPTYLSIDKKVTNIDKKFEIQQWKLVEILGLFSAILAFIITNIQIASQNLDLHQMMRLMVGMACVLLIFSISISIVVNFNDDKSKYWDFIKNNKFLAIISLSVILVVISIYL